MTRSLYRQLGDAQEAAARAGTPAPCTTGPDPWILWASDLMPQPDRIRLARLCHACPVLDACKAYRDDMHARHKALNGVVAGKHYTYGVESRRQYLGTGNPLLDAARGYRVGSIALTTAIKCAGDGATQAEIALLAGVKENTVASAFRVLRERAGGMRGAA